jgi:phage baseplate assembly protein W
MANPLSRFNLTHTEEIESITYSDYISQKSPLGDYKKISNINVIINSWNNILLTPRGSYDHDPEYGSRLYEYLYEPADSDTMNNIRDEIIEMISRYDDRASIDSIDVKYIRPPNQGFVVYIVVLYEGDRAPLTIHIKDTSQ